MPLCVGSGRGAALSKPWRFWHCGQRRLGLHSPPGPAPTRTEAVLGLGRDLPVRGPASQGCSLRGLASPVPPPGGRMVSVEGGEEGLHRGGHVDGPRPWAGGR